MTTCVELYPEFACGEFFDKVFTEPNRSAQHMLAEPIEGLLNHLW
jgi:hypothetical protein